jgi:hypothetical protein
VDFQSPDWFSTPNAQGSGIVGSMLIDLLFLSTFILATYLTYSFIYSAFVRRRLWVREITSHAPES